MEVDVVTLAAEFPNDNPALHAGAIWTCETVTAPPTAELAPAPAMEPEPALAMEPEAAPAMEPEPAPTVEVACEAEELVVEPAPAPLESGFFATATTAAFDEDGDPPPVIEELPPLDDVALEAIAAAPPAADDPFTVLVAALADVASAAGIAPELVVRLFAGEPLADLDAAASEALAAADILREGAVTPAFLRAMSGWQALLRGTSEDFDACGGKMLDEWTSELLACLGGSPAKASTLRRELRSRGVAAFGLAA